ncbi:chromate reductase [Pedobacter sp. UYP30]|uniref:NADPH-dependent FMN reductase n=1 Tax=Pedobacter sp. UYP30 TaxID=1756400 RepID=UPI003396715A
MIEKKKVFVIIGSASNHSTNEKLINYFADLTKNVFDLIIFKELKKLPHFDPQLSENNPPTEVIEFRRNIEESDAVLICTPEYVFSIPSGLKNAFEWCVSTTIFSEKITGIITASADGRKGHEELQLILKTLMAKINEQTCLLIQGIKGKINNEGVVIDQKTISDLLKFIENFKHALKVK